MQRKAGASGTRKTEGVWPVATARARAVVSVLAACGCFTASAWAENAVVVRFHDDNAVAARPVLSTSALSELERVLGVRIAAQARTQDGGFRLSLAADLDPLALRSAVNRLRETGAVVYANVDSGGGAQPKLTLEGSTGSRLIVKLRATGKTDVGVKAMATKLAAEAVQSTVPLSGGAMLVSLAQGAGVDAAARLAGRLAADADVEYVEIDRRAHVATLPGDPLFGSQWSLTDPVSGIDATGAWSITTGAPGVTVALLDTGILPHPDVAGRYVQGYDFVSDPAAANDGDGRDADPTDAGDWLTAADVADPAGPFAGCATGSSTWHGTQVAGIVGARTGNGEGIAGVDWSAALLPVRVSGRCGAVVSDIADGLRWAAGLSVPGVPANPHPARVVNISLAGRGPCGPTLQSAVNDATAAGALVVAAAGNDGDDVENHFPANCNGVLAVAGIARDGSRASFSNAGTRIAVAAPSGGNGGSAGSILTPGNAGTNLADPAGYGYSAQVGTSLAAPLVAGVASLLAGRDPGLTPAELIARLERTARAFPLGTAEDCSRSLCGAGIVDAGAALSAASPDNPPAPAPSPSPADPTPPVGSQPQPVTPPYNAGVPPPYPVGDPSTWRSKQSQPKKPAPER